MKQNFNGSYDPINTAILLDKYIKLAESTDKKIIEYVDEATEGLASEEYVDNANELVKEYVDDAIANIDIPSEESVQGDWTQNDSTAPDYIKNRPFYEERVTEYTDITTFTYTSSGMYFIEYMNSEDIELHCEGTVIPLQYVGMVEVYETWLNEEAGCKIRVSVLGDNGDVTLPESMIGKEITIKGQNTTIEVHRINRSYLPSNVVYEDQIRTLKGLIENVQKSLYNIPNRIYLRPIDDDSNGYDYYDVFITGGKLSVQGRNLD